MPGELGLIVQTLALHLCFQIDQTGEIAVQIVYRQCALVQIQIDFRVQIEMPRRRFRVLQEIEFERHGNRIAAAQVAGGKVEVADRQVTAGLAVIPFQVGVADVDAADIETSPAPGPRRQAPVPPAWFPAPASTDLANCSRLFRCAPN